MTTFAGLKILQGKPSRNSAGGTLSTEPFFQLDSRLAWAYEGSGLGLALVKQIVELLGGSVAVESKLGKWNHFTVTLPWKN